MSVEGAEAARQLAESLTAAKITTHAVVQGSAAYVVSAPVVIDYSAPAVYIPLIFSILGGIHISMLIYSWIEARINKSKESK